MAKLVVLTEGFAGTSYELKVERTTIGRVEDNAFQIPEPSVSSHHCEVLLRGGDIVVKDLNSTNGTFINGEQIKESALKPGQILRLGQVELRLENGAGAAAAKKPLDHTAVITRGVKLNELEHTTQPVGSPFAKKSDKANKVFLYVGLLVGTLIIAVIIWAIISL
jgi:pSer/pThr/pTyr-binding forkhead associated (FHA) protein